MGIKHKGNLSELKAKMREAKVRVDQAIFRRLSKIGEELVNHARSIPADVGYTDRTGNLRSSTGYIVAKDGEVVTAVFKQVKGRRTRNAEGTNAGLNHALSVMTKFPGGWVLIMVAGMDYALTVESRGRDVLSGTEIIANKKIPIEVGKLKDSINRMKL